MTHYGLRLAPRLELLPSIRLFKRLDFIFHAQSAAEKFGADLIYTWLPQSAVLGLWCGLSRCARNARGRGWEHGRVVAASILEGKRDAR